jgi:hypothetical protein
MMRKSEQDRRAEEFLLEELDWPEPQTFTALADKRASDLHIEALRRTIWALIESGALSLTPDRRIYRSERSTHRVVATERSRSPGEVE